MKKRLIAFLIFLVTSIFILPFALPYERGAPPILYLIYSDHVETYYLGTELVIFHIGFWISLISWSITILIGSGFKVRKGSSLRTKQNRTGA